MIPSIAMKLKPVLSISLMLFCFSNEILAQTLDHEPAKKEGRIVVYGTTFPNVMAPIHTGFEKKYGVKVDYWRASATAVVDRAITEWRAGKPGFDVLFAINGTIALLKRENALAKFTAPSAAKFPAHLKDKDGVLTAFRHTPVSILYNTELVKAADLPTNFDDLLNPMARQNRHARSFQAHQYRAVSLEHAEG